MSIAIIASVFNWKIQLLRFSQHGMLYLLANSALPAMVLHIVCQVNPSMPLVSAGIGSSVKPDALLEVKHDSGEVHLAEELLHELALLFCQWLVQVHCISK